VRRLKTLEATCTISPSRICGAWLRAEEATAMWRRKDIRGNAAAAVITPVRTIAVETSCCDRPRVRRMVRTETFSDDLETEEDVQEHTDRAL